MPNVNLRKKSPCQPRESDRERGSLNMADFFIIPQRSTTRGLTQCKGPPTWKTNNGFSSVRLDVRPGLLLKNASFVRCFALPPCQKHFHKASSEEGREQKCHIVAHLQNNQPKWGEADGCSPRPLQTRAELKTVTTVWFARKKAVKHSYGSELMYELCGEAHACAFLTVDMESPHSSLRTCKQMVGRWKGAGHYYIIEFCLHFWEIRGGSVCVYPKFSRWHSW